MMVISGSRQFIQVPGSSQCFLAVSIGYQWFSAVPTGSQQFPMVLTAYQTLFSIIGDTKYTYFELHHLKGGKRSTAITRPISYIHAMSGSLGK